MSNTTDTNQPDHIVDMHEMVTDTNQASEDVVDTILSTLGIFDRKIGNRPGQIEVVKQIIRTEKLKLLAEVRERVVGEDDYQPGSPAPDLVEHNQLVRDGLRFEQRTELTKLEAEL